MHEMSSITLLYTEADEDVKLFYKVSKKDYRCPQSLIRFSSGKYKNNVVCFLGDVK